MGRQIWTCVWTAAFAIVLTAAVSGVWTGLLLANLASTPAVPWAAAVMAVVLGAAWWLIGGWGPAGSREKRRTLLRGAAPSSRLFAWAMIAGLCWIVFLAGFWVVVHQLVAAPSNPLPDLSKIPPTTIVISFIMASLSGAVSEEAGFRGYFQGALERSGAGLGTVAISALVMMPEHALSQGFVWPTVAFYLLVDFMLGGLAYLTKSIVPGIVVHALGLIVFFMFVWPTDKDRPQIAFATAGVWFWSEAGLAVVFALFAGLALLRLAKVARATPASREN